MTVVDNYGCQRYFVDTCDCQEERIKEETNEFAGVEPEEERR